MFADCFHPLHVERLSVALKTTRNDGSLSGPIGKFTLLSIPTLAHFLAILGRPRPSTIPPNTRLIIIDSFSALFNSSLPKDPHHHAKACQPSRGGEKRNAPSKGALRRTQALQHVVNALQKLAAARNCAVVVLSQCATRMQANEQGATLVPAIGATVWEHGISTRIVLFRDWAWARSDGQQTDGKQTAAALVGLRFAGLQKRNGQQCTDFTSVAAFQIESVSYASPWISFSP